jgi:hypothetical protein
MVINVLGAPNFRSLKQAWRLWSGRGSAQRHGAVRMPGYVLATVVLLSWVLILHQGISATDWAIHFTISPVAILRPFGRNQASELAQYLPSRPFNDSKCAEWRIENANDVTSYARNSCGIYA